MVENISNKKIMAFGATGQGKSYLLNILSGVQQGQKPFKIGSSNLSCTDKIQMEKGHKLFGTSDVLIDLLDVPGLYDTMDMNIITQKEQNQKTAEKPKSIIYLEKIFEEGYELCNKKLHQLFIVIKHDTAVNQITESIINIAKMLVNKECVAKNICLILTKMNNSKQQYRKQLCKSWHDTAKNYGITNVFFFGKLDKDLINKYVPTNDQDGTVQECKNEFIEFIRNTQEVDIRNFQDLSTDEKKIIEKAFNFTFGEWSCFSLDMVVYSSDLQEIKLRDLVPGMKLKNFETETDDIYLTPLHYSKVEECLFLKIQFRKILYKNNLNQQQQEQNKKNIYSELEITPDHLIFVLDDNQNIKEGKFIHAKNLKIGNSLLKYSLDGSPEILQIINIEFVRKTGYLSPLTNSGLLFVNGIKNSCYAPKQNWISHKISHLSIMPLIKWEEIKYYINNYRENNQQKLQTYCEKDTHFNSYAKFLHQIFNNNKIDI